MKRQLVIGSLIGVVLGGALTASIAHGMFDRGAEKTEQERPAKTKQESLERTLSTYDGLPPLRPGGVRIAPEPQAAPTRQVPVAVDLLAAGPDSPTV